MKDYLRNFKDFSKNSVALSEGRVTIDMKDDGFTGDLDQADDGIITLDSLAMDEFGMTYDQLGPGEREWCQDEYDNLNK
jgi:hypothetical protein